MPFQPGRVRCWPYGSTTEVMRCEGKGLGLCGFRSGALKGQLKVWESGPPFQGERAAECLASAESLAGGATPDHVVSKEHPTIEGLCLGSPVPIRLKHAVKAGLAAPTRPPTGAL